MEEKCTVIGMISNARNNLRLKESCRPVLLTLSTSIVGEVTIIQIARSYFQP